VSDIKTSTTEKWQSLETEIISCRKCPRLVSWREEVAKKRKRAFMDWTYWGKPVPGFGDPRARLLVVGLAPGAHGSNRTGRMFTGDASGEFLYAALNRAGFANQSTSFNRQDGLELHDVWITAVCRCAPPDNKPARPEVLNCRPYLLQEIELLSGFEGIVALGRIAFDNVLEIYRRKGSKVFQLKFAHGGFYRLGEKLPWLMASFHPSRQNTQTGRLTPAMFDQVWNKAHNLLSSAE
jgi:uracil-DNA glycosylase family 4